VERFAMTISSFSTSSENQGVWRNVDGEAAVERPGSAVAEPLLRVVPTHFGVQAILALVGGD
jgi:hypothetical protein